MRGAGFTAFISFPFHLAPQPPNAYLEFSPRKNFLYMRPSWMRVPQMWKESFLFGM